MVLKGDHDIWCGLHPLHSYFFFGAPTTCSHTCQANVQIKPLFLLHMSTRMMHLDAHNMPHASGQHHWHSHQWSTSPDADTSNGASYEAPAPSQHL